MREWGRLVVIVVIGAIMVHPLAARSCGPAQIPCLSAARAAVGKVVRGTNTARFARTLATLTSSAVPVLEALRISGEVVTNLPMRDAVQDAATRVREGRPIGRSLAASKLFPPMMIHLISSGETSGELEVMLDRAATNQEREMDAILDSGCRAARSAHDRLHGRLRPADRFGHAPSNFRAESTHCLTIRFFSESGCASPGRNLAARPPTPPRTECTIAGAGIVTSQPSEPDRECRDSSFFSVCLWRRRYSACTNDCTYGQL